MIETLALSLALGAMQVPLATTAQLKTRSQVPVAAQAAGPTAPLREWDDLMDKIYKDGVAAKDNSSQMLSGTVGVRTAAHTTHTALVFLARDKNNELAATDAGLGITNFTPTGKAGEFRTEGWILILSQYGEVMEAHHTEGVGSYAVGFLQTKTEKLDLAAPAVKARLDESMRYWIQK